MNAKDETLAALEDAIRNYLATFETGHGVLTDWLVIAAQENVDDTGKYNSSVAVLFPSDTFPLHRILGLLDHATTSYRAMVANFRPET